MTNSVAEKIEKCFIGVVLVAATFLIISLPKKIWIDEFLGFAFAAYPTFSEALAAMHDSLDGVNFGQTGAYFVLNYALLKLFGAHYFALRLPSFVAYLASLFFFQRILLELRVTPAIRLLSLGYLALHPWNLPMGAEARSYILLQATVLGFYYGYLKFSATHGQAGIRTIFISSLLGICFHPYYVMYAGLLVVSSWILPGARHACASLLGTPRKLLSLVVPLFLIQIAIGNFSWFRIMGNKMGMDPYQWIGTDRSVTRIVIGVLYAPYAKFVLVGAILLLIPRVFFWFLGEKRIGEDAKIFFSILFTLISAQMILIWSSISSGYWILERQWIASIPLALILLAKIVDFNLSIVSFLKRRFSLMLAFLVSLFAVCWNIQTNFDRFPSSQLTEEEIIKTFEKKEMSPEEYVALAHENLSRGGEVWPLFARYYSK